MRYRRQHTFRGRRRGDISIFKKEATNQDRSNRNPPQPLSLRAAAGALAIRGLMHEAALKAAEDPGRLSFLHAVRVVRRKLPRFVAIPPSGQKSVP